MTDEKSKERLEEIVGDSRRSFMKKGVLASSALALGVVGSGAITAAGSNQQVDQAVVFAYDYNPDMSFQVVASLEEDVVDAILGYQVDGEPIVSNSGDYTGYIVYYQQNGNALGECAFVFTYNATLQENQQYQFGTDAMMLAARGNLLETRLSTGDGGNGATTEGGATTTLEAETATTEEGATTTTEEGTITTTEGGTTTTENGTTTTEEGDGGGGNGGEPADQAVVFTYDYNPNMSFQVVASLEENVVDAILGHQVDGEPIVSDPTDFNGYVVYCQQDGNAPGEFALAFTRNATLQQNQQYQFSTDAMTFIDRANLLEVRISTGGDGEATTTTEEGTTTSGEGTTTTEGGTTSEGGATTTTEGGTTITTEAETTTSE